jgi:hypothetical protein
MLDELAAEVFQPAGVQSRDDHFAQLSARLASAGQVAAAIEDLAAFTADPGTTIADPRIFQVWAQRRWRRRGFIAGHADSERILPGSGPTSARPARRHRVAHL